ncbi:MAG: hypothetical protein KGO82_10975 [Bacteroidota bacterium]|nr:hypothetical protein [Bacteroidota bacterium]
MEQYTTRVRLPKAAVTDYDALDAAMEKARFRLKTRNRRELEEGAREYRFTGSGGFLDIANAVYDAVKSIGVNYSFTIQKR